MLYTIKNDRLTVAVDTRGAELQSVKLDGKERLWQNADGSWSSHAPVLFPVCGNCGVTVGNTQYPIPKHGVVRYRQFTCVEARPKSVVLQLTSDAETMAQYPFPFVFTVSYRVDDNRLFVTYRIDNPADAPLPFSCGGHESFTLDGPLEKHMLVFPRPTHVVCYPHDAAGHLTGAKCDLGVVAEWSLNTSLLTGNNTVIFGNIDCKKAALCTQDGRRVAQVTFDGFDHLLLWRPQNANMICIEPWNNLPDVAGEKDGEFADKVTHAVPPHEHTVLTRTVTYY